AYIGTGQTAVLAEFLSDPFPDRQQVTSATVSLFLVTGRMGMEACADITVELARRTPPQQRTVVASATVATSILPRGQTVNPIDVVLPVNGVLTEAGDRLALLIAVANACPDLRGPNLLYDALGTLSVITFDPGTTTTTTTTTTTSTTIVPLPPSC